MQRALCGVCNQSVFSRPPSDVAGWVRDGFHFIVRATSEIPHARSTAPLNLADEVAALVWPPAHVAYSAPATRVSSWALARVAALAGSVRPAGTLQTYCKSEYHGNYALDLQVGRRRELVAGITLLGGADFCVVLAQHVGGGASAAEVFVASLCAEPRIVSSVRLSVRCESYTPDPDVFRPMPDRNVFGFDGTHLLGWDNVIFDTGHRLPPDDVTPDVARKVFQVGDPPRSTVHLERGYPERRTTAALVKALFEPPNAPRLAGLSLEAGDPESGYDAILATIMARAPNLRSLTLGDPQGVVSGDRFHDVDLRLVDGHGGLARIELGHVGAIRLPGVSLPELEELIVHQQLDPADVSFLADFAGARLPRLKTLYVELQRGRTGAIETAALAPLLSATATPSLTHLTLGSFLLDDEAVEALARSELLPRLRSLRLWWTRIGEVGLQALVAHSERFRHLQQLSIDAASGASTTLSAIRARLPHANVSPRSVEVEPATPTLRRVRHPKFGVGTVLSETGLGAGAKLRIRFEKVGEKTLLAEFVSPEET